MIKVKQNGINAMYRLHSYMLRQLFTATNSKALGNLRL